MSGTEIKPCDCKSEYQDKRYGTNQRVHNKGGSKGAKKLKCSVCSKIK